MRSIGTIQEAYKTLVPLLGPAASWVFAISLLASGLSSSTVGTMAGQVIMQGFLRRQIPPWLRRGIDDGAFNNCDCAWIGAYACAGFEPGGAQLRHSICIGSPDSLYRPT